MFIVIPCRAEVWGILAELSQFLQHISPKLQYIEYMFYISVSYGNLHFYGKHGTVYCSKNGMLKYEL